jgi:predicted  nucleic acid-binding Zn-ribbon protein
MNSKLERKLKHLKNNLKHMRNKINELDEKRKRLEDTIYFTECEINQTFPDPYNFNMSYVVKGFSIQEVKK